jgi:hypothetical protein
VALKKPSDLFEKKQTSGVFESPEVSPYITESYDKFLENYETITQITEKTNVFEKIEQLSNLVELFSQNLEEKLDKTDLENAMLSQMMVLDENFKLIQSEVKGLNKKDLQEFKRTTNSLTEVVDNFLNVELPKYKNKVIKTEVFVGEQVKKLKENVEEDISNLQENIDTQFNNIAEVVDNNINYFNNKLEETSFQVKETKKTYSNLSKILENKILEENQKIEEYSKIVDDISSTFEELSLTLKKEINHQSNLTEEKFDEYKEYFESISSSLIETINKKSSNIEESVDDKLEDYRKELVDVKADVIINEKHINNVDKYLKKHHQELEELKEEVFSEIEKLSVGNLQDNLERLEKKIDFIRETYSRVEPEVIVKEVIKEGLLNEPPSTDNKDPLTPLDQNFVTFDQLQQHYRLFLNRIQQQLSTLGGGGETRLKYLDDIVGIATNPSAYDDKFLKYNHSLGKFEFVTVSGGSGDYASVAGIATVAQGLTNTPNISVSSVSIIDNDSGSDYSGEVVSLQKSYTTITQTLTPTSLHKVLSVDEYGTVEYSIQATNGIDFHTVKILSVNNGISINNLEVSSVSTGSTFVSYDVTIENELINLVATPTTTDRIIYSMIYTAITKPYSQYTITDENNNALLTEDDKTITVQF